MDSRRQHNGMHTPLQQQQFPPLLPQGGGHPPRLPLPLPHPNMGFNPRPSSFSGPLAGQKRNLRFSDGGGFTKLFVASLPRNITEDEVRDLFGGFGNVLEVIFLKDKKTGLPQGCCFVKYASASDAERAIRALDNQRTLPGGPAPLQVKLADGEREHSGPMEHKLFVGSLNRQANEQEIEEIFAPYGRVENVYIIRDERKQSRGCAFVSFPERDMAISAISALNGVYRMKGCHQPIIVRFADPKRPRSGERDASRMGGSGTNFSPRSHHGGPGMSLNLQSQPAIGPPRGSSGPTMESHNSPFGWRQGGGAGGVGLLPQTGILPLGSSGSTPAPKGPLEGSNTVQGLRGNNLSNQMAPGVSDQSSVTGMASQIPQQQGFKDPPLQKASGQMYGPLQHSGAQQSVPGSTTQHNQLQPLQGYPPSQSTEARLQQAQPQQASIAQYAPSQPSSQGHIYGQPSAPSQPLQPQVPSSLQQPNSGLSSQTLQQTITGLSSQPLQQPITGLSSQPMQQPLQGLSSQPQQQPLTGLSTQPSQHSLTGLSSQPLQQAITGLSSQAPHQPITGLSSQPLQQPVAGMASQPLQQPITGLSSQPVQYQPLRPQESQPNLQTATSQAIQQAQQFLSLQPIQPQMSKESTQQGYLQPLQSTAQANQQPISAQVSWSIPLQQQLLHQSQQSQSVVSQTQTHISQQQAMPLQHQAVPVQQQATPAVATVTPSPMPTPTVATCDWTEHTSPEGHKYYYNSKTGESRWEKPEEFAAFERQQQQQQLLASQPQQPQQQAQHQQPQQQPQQQVQQQPQQLLQLQQLQGGQAQLQAQLQHMQPQQLNPQYQQQQFQQQVQLQPFQQQSQAQVQQGQQPSQLPQPQLQQLPQNQQLQQQVQLQQLQHPASQVQQQQQQQQREVQYNGQGMLLQVPSSGSFQAVQGYMQLQPGSQSLSGLGDASRTAAVQQQLSSNQQIPAANGLADTTRVAQWTPALQQGVVSQDWMWKTKPAGS